MYGQARLILSALTAALLTAFAPDSPVSAQPSPSVPGGAAEQRLRDAYGKVPLAFVPNVGQTDPRVRFSAQLGRATFYFTPEEAVFSFWKPSLGQAGGYVLGLTFLGGNPHAAIEGRQLASGRVSYLIGSEPSAWRTGLSTYAQVVYRDLWPGIDMVFRGDASRLKYEFVLRPGAKVEDIRLAYRGVESLSVDEAGQLLIETTMGTLTDVRPESYQEVAGGRVSVESRYAILPGARSAYGFAVGEHDPARPLVIDPGIVYSTYLGGANSDVGNPIAVDLAGDVYVTGMTNSTAFPTTFGAFDTTWNSNFDVFVTKLMTNGSGPLDLLYSTYLGGGQADRGYGIAVDAAGHVYVTGETASNNFPTTPGGYDTTYNGGVDAFVARLNPAGTGLLDLLYSTYLGGGNADRGYDIALDGGGNAYVVGETLSSGLTPFPTTLGAYDTSYNGSGDAFIAKIDPNAAGPASLVYSTYLGGAQSENDFATGVAGSGIAVAGGFVYVTGHTSSPGFPTTVGVFDTSHNGGDDVFVAKLNPAGLGPVDLVYSTFLGGSNQDRGFGIAVDAGGNAYVTGETSSNNFPTTAGAFDTSHNGGFDAFVTRLNPTGTAPLSYSTYLGGTSSTDGGRGIAVDAAGRVYVTGMTNSANFPTTAGAFDTSHNGSDDAFVSKLNLAGLGALDLLYSTFLGGSASDEGNGIAISGNNAYVTGETQSNNFPTTAGAYDTSYNTSGDAFVTKLDTGCAAASDCDDGQACTTDTCVAGVCAHANNANACDDGIFCNGPDVCSGGSCSVHPGDPCAGPDGDGNCSESCNEAADNCTAPDPNGSACSDGAFCNGADACSGGSCVVHAGDPCAGPDGDINCSESCNEALDNCSAPDPDGSACTDGLFCNGTDTCTGGTCTAHTGDPCPGADGDGNCSESCDEAGDDCTAPDPLGSTCTDGLFCNGTDTCALGTCSAHTGDPCPGTDGDGNCAESCDEAADNCAAPDPDGAACTDGLFCNGTDTCTAGSCITHTGDPCPGPNGDGNCSESCDEGADNCTAPDPNGTACTDLLFCNGTDTCSGGSCSAHTGDPCAGADGDGNCSESCNEVLDDCTAPDPDGSACTDSLFCNGADTCLLGTCNAHTGDPCPGADGDGNCSESCDEAADNCAAPDPDGAACTDGLFCNGTDTCTAGSCSAHTGDPCPGTDGDGNCSESCDEGADNCTAPDPNGSACTDGLFCTGTDTCTGGSCTTHTGDPCPGADGDGNCSESCNEAADNCTAADPNGSACTDSLFCNGTDTCTGGSCSTHAGNPCPGADGDINCSESCDETLDNCAAPDPNGSACSDGTFCNGTDTCTGGGCTTHTGNPCPGADGDANCSESCTEAAGGSCTGADPDGSACAEDGNVCTGDQCAAGLCNHPPEPVDTPCGSSEDTDCSDPDTCDGAGNCQENDAAEGTPCSEGDICTSPDACQSGECTAGPLVGCKVTGGCQLTTGGDKVSSGLNAQTTGSGYKGQVEYNNHTDKTAYHSTRITRLEITAATSCPDGKKATIKGKIKKKGNPTEYDFTLIVEDCGEPGRNDTYSMEISDGENRSGTIDKGNIQVH